MDYETEEPNPKRQKTEHNIEVPDPRENESNFEFPEYFINDFAEMSGEYLEGIDPNEVNSAENLGSIPVQSGSGEPTEDSPSQESKDSPAPIVEETIWNEDEKYYTTFKTTKFTKVLKLKFNIANYDGHITSISDDLDAFYKRLLDPIMKDDNRFTKDDYYSVAFKNPALNNPLFIRGKKFSEFNEREFTDKVFKVCQSFDDFILNEMEVKIYVTTTATGKGHHPQKSSKTKAPTDVSETSKRRRCVITIKNTDNSCGYRAIYVGLAFYLEKFNELKNLRQSSNYKRWQQITSNCKGDKVQTEETKLLITTVNRFIHDTKCPNQLRLNLESSIPDGVEYAEGEEPIPQFCSDDCENKNYFKFSEPFGSQENHFEYFNDWLITKGYKIVIVDAQDVRNHIFVGPGFTDEDIPIYIEWQKNAKHFNFIKDMRAYVKDDFFCKACHRGHWSTNHICDGVCSVCGYLGLCSVRGSGPAIDCDVCERTFVNQRCFDHHIDPNSYGIKCQNRHECQECGCSYKFEEKKPHVCGQYKCKNCGKTYTETPHYCMLKPLDMAKLLKEDEKNKIIVTFDIESCIATQPNSDELHKPTLLVSETVCDHCWDYSKKEKVSDNCEYCGINLQVFKGYDCVSQFTSYLYFDLAKRAEHNKSRILVFAHNNRGYDGHFILQDLFKRDFSDQPTIILQGLKVLKISVNNVEFIDSLSFFSQSLAELPKSFGFAEVVVKGFFPHKFHTEENFNYVGLIPPLEFFGIEHMKEPAANNCKEWHADFEAKQRSDPRLKYILLKELLKYCKNDVKILTIAVMEFRRHFSSVTQLDPTTRNFTLASVAMEHFRSSVLKKDQVAVTPLNDYIVSRNKSKKADVWLDWLQKCAGTTIKREFKIGPYYVDGHIPRNNEVCEFWGCFFHGCPECYPEGRNQGKEFLKNNKSFNEVFGDTTKKIEFLERKGFKLSQIWEHEYNQMKTTDPILNEYHKERISHYKSIEEIGHIITRHSFFGGRTNNLFFNYECEESERIRYLDVTSLYPSVLVKNPYPIGHPEVKTEFNSTDISEFFGFIKCRVLAPKNLYIPVLPYRSRQKKLLFPLCSLCAESKSDSCTHTNKERQFIGTWFSEELKLAVSKGYKIKEIYEVLHYEQKSDDIFKPYIRTWLKLKTESSGWPSSCDTEEKKFQFINDFKEREGIDLEYAKMEKNPGLRFISKLMLNSLWGKLGQRRNQTQTVICSNYNEFYGYILDAKYKVKGIIPIDDNKFLVNYVFTDDTYDKAGNTNIAIASMVTGYARIKLYSILDQIESGFRGRVLYFDTDSVIFRDKPALNLPIPEIGDFLGDMTDEVEKDYGSAAYIDRFASGGPKNYAYTVNTGNGHKITTKIKGINITSGLKDILNFETVNELAKEYRNGNEVQLRVEQLQFRTNSTHSVYTRLFNKKYRAVSEKRIVIREGPIQTLPFGYKD